MPKSGVVFGFSNLVVISLTNITKLTIIARFRSVTITEACQIVPLLIFDFISLSKPSVIDKFFFIRYKKINFLSKTFDITSRFFLQKFIRRRDV